VGTRSSKNSSGVVRYSAASTLLPPVSNCPHWGPLRTCEAPPWVSIPLWIPWRPESHAARDGIHGEFATYARSNRTASAANASISGVVPFPYP